MLEQFSRTTSLLGEEGMKILENSHVVVFGIGGVGSYAAEALVRSGLSRITLVDYDIIDITNLNRQIHAILETVGKKKTEVMKDRLLSINKNLVVNIINEKYTEENKEIFFKDKYDYIVDAIDIITSKLSLIENAKEKNIKIISSMGTGNKIQPERLKIGDIYETYECPLAKVMRRELKKRNIKDLKVVWSDEKPLIKSVEMEDNRKSIPRSISFVPPVAGMIMASVVIRDLVFGGE